MPSFVFTQDGTKYFYYQHTADDTIDKADPIELQQNIAIYALLDFWQLSFNKEIES